MQHISSVLLRLGNDLGLQERMLLQQIEESWQETFGKPISLHTSPSDLKDAELTINVDSPVWLQQLKFLQPMMLKKLDKYHLKSIKLRLGKIKRKSKVNSPANKQKISALSKSDREWLNKLLSDVPDAEIRESIKKAIHNSLIHGKKKE